MSCPLQISPPLNRWPFEPWHFEPALTTLNPGAPVFREPPNRSPSPCPAQHYDIHDDEPDSDGLEIPAANPRITRAPPTPAVPEPDIQLYPQLQALANHVNYQPITISGSDNSYFLPDVPSMFLRHMFPTSPGQVNPSANEPHWQLPSNILHQMFFSQPQHHTNTI